MSGLPHVEKVKSHFISGEPGTTGREPFEDSISRGLIPETAAGLGSHGGSNTLGSSTHHQSSTTGNNLTGASGQHTGIGGNTHSGSSGLTGGINSGLNNQTAAGGLGHGSGLNSGAGAGVAGAGLGAGALSGNEDRHRSVNDSTHPHTTDYGLGADKHGKDDRSMGEKIKDALPGGSNSNTTHSTTHNTHHTQPVDTNANHNRGIVDKINDALPGTPAKTEQAYAGGVADHQAGAGTAYGAGKHGTDHPSSGVHVGHDNALHGERTSASAASVAGSGLAGSGLGSHTHDNTTHGTHGTHGHSTSGFTGSGIGSTTHDNTTHGTHGHSTSGVAGSGIGSSTHDNTTHRDHTHSTTGVTGAGVGSHSHSGVGSHSHDNDNTVHGIHQDTSQRAPGQSKGGLSGLLATSDKDFTGRERQGEGAYADTDGHFELNKSGPAGNPALTGREGDLSKNPVAQAKSRSEGTHTEAEPEKKSLIQKIKDVL